MQRSRDGTLLLGDFAITGISGELSAGGADHALSASGLATVLGRPWRMTGRLGRAGSDGSATVAISLDGQGAGVGTGVALVGQVAADGSVSGRMTGRGPDLSLLLPAPPQPWNADGRLVGGQRIGGGRRSGVDDRRLPCPAAPWRFGCCPSCGWMRHWPPTGWTWTPGCRRCCMAGRWRLPTGIDFSAEAASLAGGTLRRLRAGFELAGSGVTLRDSGVVLARRCAAATVRRADGHAVRGGRTTDSARLRATAGLAPAPRAGADERGAARHAAHRQFFRRGAGRGWHRVAGQLAW